MKKISRRDFLKTGAAMPVVLGSPWLLKDRNGRQPGSPPKARVAAVRGSDLKEMTRESLDALGGISSIIDAGDSVFIKPNFVSFPWAQYNNCFRTGECTKPEILIALSEECLIAGASEVIIGEGSHLPTFDWHYAETLDGRTNLVKEAERLSARYKGKVSLACLETDSPAWDEIPSRTVHGKIAISSLAARADKVISVPVAKTHAWAQLTLAAKNFIGITPLARYAQLVDNTWWNRGTFDHSSPATIARVYLDIVKSLRPALSIVDFSIGIEGDGPTRTWGGTTLDVRERLGSWALIASTDIMAADAAAARIMNHDTSKVVQLSMGYEMGLGEIREEATEYLGENPEKLRMEWRHAQLKG